MKDGADLFREALLEWPHPGLEVELDRSSPLHGGRTFIDVTQCGVTLFSIEWDDVAGRYGICDCGDPGYGQHSDHILAFDAALARAFRMIEGKWENIE